MYNIVASLYGCLGINPFDEGFEVITADKAGELVKKISQLESRLIASVDNIVKTSENNMVMIHRASQLLRDEKLIVDSIYSISSLDDFLKEFREATASIREVLAEFSRKGYGEQDVNTLLDIRDKVKDYVEEMPDFRNELSGRTGDEQPVTDDNKQFQHPQKLRLPNDEKVGEDPRRQGEDADSSGHLQEFLEKKHQSGG